MSIPLLTVKIERKLKFSNIADLMVTALEGGSNYWLWQLKTEPEDFDLKSETDWVRLFSTDKPALRLFYITEEEVEEATEDNRKPVSTLVLVERDNLERALALTVVRRLLEVEDGLIVDHDAHDADFFLQELLLGQQVYG